MLTKIEALALAFAYAHSLRIYTLSPEFEHMTLKLFEVNVRDIHMDDIIKAYEIHTDRLESAKSYFEE